MRAYNYSTAKGVSGWYKRCGFKNHEEAYSVLGCNWRTWFRYLKQGLPRGLSGKLIAERMGELEEKRAVLDPRK